MRPTLMLAGAVLAARPLTRAWADTDTAAPPAVPTGPTKEF